MASKKKDKSVGQVSPEIGHSGYGINTKQIGIEAEKDLRFPLCLKTYDTMAMSPVIGATLAAINTIVAQVPFSIKSFDQTDTHKFRQEFLNQCLFKDMDRPFSTFILEAMTATQYGFAVCEKVFRFRRREKGSKYDDGRIGIKYLPLRPQHSIVEIKRDESNREVSEVIQAGQTKGSVAKLNLNSTDEIKLPIDRVLLFRVEPTSNNLYGKSPLSRAYKSWRVSSQLKDIEAVSVNRNLNGIPHLSCPSELLDEDEQDAEQMKRVKTLKTNMSRVSTGEQSYIITPSDKYDQSQGGGGQYDFKLVTGSSSHLTALSGVIVRYDNEIFQALCADVLTLDNGQSGGGASITSNKQTMLNMFVEARVKEIVDLINNDLIPDLFRRNGWDITKCPKLEYGRIEKLSVDVLAKAIQQLMATNSIPLTVENINHIMEVFGFPTRLPLDMSREDLLEVLGFGLEMQSKSGSGMERGKVGEGTANSFSGEDKNAKNLNKS